MIGVGLFSQLLPLRRRPGATYTSAGYRKSLQSALDKVAGL